MPWFQHMRRDGRTAFVRHTIMQDHATEANYGVAFSPPQAIDVANIDGDGLTDIVVGKRHWTHGPNKDLEPGTAPVLYWFQLERRPGGVHFQPHMVDDWSGVGL